MHLLPLRRPQDFQDLIAGHSGSDTVQVRRLHAAETGAPTKGQKIQNAQPHDPPFAVHCPSRSYRRPIQFPDVTSPLFVSRTNNAMTFSESTGSAVIAHF